MEYVVNLEDVEDLRLANKWGGPENGLTPRMKLLQGIAVSEECYESEARRNFLQPITEVDLIILHMFLQILLVMLLDHKGTIDQILLRAANLAPFQWRLKPCGLQII